MTEGGAFASSRSNGEFMMNDLWNKLAGQAGVSLTEAQHASMERYIELLLEANQTMNLTRIPDVEAARVQHVADSLTLLPLIPAAAMDIADVGSGGGVPGIPLAIVLPTRRFVLIESTKKKAVFLERAVTELGLTNVRVLAERVEDVARGELRETFDIAIGRAVGRLVWLVEWCLPLLKKGGDLLAMKGAKAAEEIEESADALKWLHGSPPETHAVELPGTEHHVIVRVRKLGKSDPRFPRPATFAKGRPLGK